MIFFVIYILSIILPFGIVQTIIKKEALDVRGLAILYLAAFVPGLNTMFSLMIIYLFIRGYR